MTALSPAAVSQSEQLEHEQELNILKLFTVGRWAVLVSKPVGIALAVLYGKTAKTKHPVHIVSTADGAARFLGRSLDAIGIAVSH